MTADDRRDFHEAVRRLAQRGEGADDLYRTLLSSPQLKDRRRLTYRCATSNRCLLLDAIDAGPLGVVIHQKRYKYSHEVNVQRSNEAGRAKNTSDGENHWSPRTYYSDQSTLSHPEEPHYSLSVQCDDVGVLKDGSPVTLLAADFHADWEAGHAVVLVAKDGSRRPVG